MPAELHVVAVAPTSAMFEDEDELVLTTIERPHPGIVLCPDAEVLELVVDFGSRGEECRHMPPVHEDEVERPFDAVAGEQLAGPF
jgi:hypothetical protein